MMDSLNELVRVKCGFAGVRDIRTMSHEDRCPFLSFALIYHHYYLDFG